MVDVSEARRSYLFIQPIDGHWNTTFPLIGVLLSAGWHVTLCSSPEAYKVVTGRLLNEKCFSNLSYTPLSSRSLLTLAKQWWTIVHLGPRLAEQKGLASEGLRSRISRTFFALGVLRFLSLLPSVTKVVFESHQRQSISDPNLRARKYTFARYIERASKQILEKRISAYCVYGDAVRNAIVCDSQLQIAPPVLLGPTVLSIAKTLKKVSQVGLQVVIPGRIDRRRRDYEWIAQIPKESRGKISLALVGRAQRTEDYQIIEMIKDLGFITDPELNGSYVSQSKYDVLCKKADIIVAPVHITFGTRTIGRDTITGVLLDAAFFGKKCLIPEGLEIDDHYSDLVVRYHSPTRLAQLIVEMTRNRLDRYELSETERIALESRVHELNRKFNQQLLTLINQPIEADVRKKCL